MIHLPYLNKGELLNSNSGPSHQPHDRKRINFRHQTKKSVSSSSSPLLHNNEALQIRTIKDVKIDLGWTYHQYERNVACARPKCEFIINIGI